MWIDDARWLGFIPSTNVTHASPLRSNSKRKPEACGRERHRLAKLSDKFFEWLEIVDVCHNRA